MDNSAPENDHSPQELSPGELRPTPPSERRSVRRRLVQSTLFLLKPQPQEREANEDAAKGERDRNEDENGEEEECTGSQSKRKRKPKGKLTPTRRSSEKLKGKRSGSNTPKKDLTNTQSEDAPLVIPNLRFEAKMTAQENSRIFAGKQIHPFFSSCKTSKKNQEVTDLESNQFAAGRDKKEITCGPIHVFERTQDNAEALDWRTWTFHEGIFMNSNFVLENACSSIFEGSVECLSFDMLSINSNPSNTSVLQDTVSFDQCPIQQECFYETAPTAFDLSNDEKVICYQPLKDAELIQINYSQDSEVTKVDSFSGHTGVVMKPDIGQQSRFLEERMKSYYFDCGNQPRDSLWTYKYQPKNALEVCGNDESVNFLSQWLQHWRERNFCISKEAINCDTGDRGDGDYICSESDSDLEKEREAGGLKNVLLVTGPVGSGKSAAIYACAREQGFEVLEVSASECRNGALVKQRFGEALESRQLKRSLGNPVGSLSKLILKPSNLANGIATQELDDEVVELIPLSDEDCRNATGGFGISYREESGSCCSQSEVKPLILFEDVDITFLEDRGFIAAVQQIAETAKGPIVLTSNSHNPFLPDNLDREQIYFTPPSQKELLCHFLMVCAAERVNIQPVLLERFVGCCRGDMRKTIMHLQFWCQGRASMKARKRRRTCGSLPFDLEVGHQILPKLIPWELPSQLSELVDNEISTSLSREENSCLMEAIEEEELDKREIEFSFSHNNETETIEAKKARMLSRNCSIHEYDEFRTQLDTVHEFSDNSDTPFSCSRRNARGKQDMILSSDSEDEKIGDGCNIFMNRDGNNELFFEGSLPFTEVPFSASDDMDEKLQNCSEAAGCIPINDECKSLDVSCVPESTFVPETEIYNGAEVHLRDTMEEVSVSNRLPVEADYLDISKSEIQKDSDTFESNQCVAEFCELEEMDDSQNEHVEAVAIENQVMDESSRMDFHRLPKYVEKPKPLVVTDLVQKLWNKLRVCRADLAQYVRSEEQQHLQIVKLTDEVSNLISETDVLLSNCQPLTGDSLEPSMIPSGESDAYSSYDKWLLASTTAQHGFCFYAKNIAAVGSTIGSETTVDLASELLASATDMMALGKLAGHGMISSLNTCSRTNSGSLEKADISSRSENNSSLVDVIQSIVPSKSCMALKGPAYYEYLSSLRCMSRSEASRLSEENDKPRKRRRRAKRHYLSTGSLMLSPEDISLLRPINMYRENSSRPADAL